LSENMTMIIDNISNRTSYSAHNLETKINSEKLLK